MAHSHEAESGGHASQHAHEGGEGHGHHHHHHAPANFGRAFLIGIVLNTGFVVAEAVCGWWAGSLSLIADAGHNLSDVLGLVLAWVASVMAHRSATARRTYGWKRSSILAALANALLLLVSVGVIIWEAVGRLARPAPVEAGVMMAVAAVGIGVNAATALLFMRGSKSDLNIRGAFLHMAADAAVSLGVVIAGLVIALTGLMWLDPAVSLVIALLIIVSTWGLFREAFNLAVDAVPEAVEPAAVRAWLLARLRVVEVHDLHIWGVSTTETALTAHLVVAGDRREDALVGEIQEGLHERFEITHATLQIETPGARRSEADESCDAPAASPESG